MWQTVDRSGRLDRFADTWSGWTVEFWDDRYEEQVARCGDGLRVPPLNLSAAVDNVRQELGGRIFGCSRWDGPTSDALALAETLSRIAPGFAAPEDAVIAGMVRPSQQEWARFAAACDAIQAATAA
ncbi:hypothetical protein C6A85_90920 [Mycobacterium sp. ITM-2017-0098]|nr:hypothetical protein C6A85_90920 [Mycobacterium sp. ITM-2017-0098]